MKKDVNLPLPRSKNDIDRARQIAKFGFPDVAPVVPELLEWLQDGNWPVSRVLSPFLVSLGHSILPELRTVLRGQDAVWKYWCLSLVIAHLPMESLIELRDDIRQLAEQPSTDEIREEVDHLAKQVLIELEGGKDR